MPPVMPHNENPHPVADNAKKKVVRKAVEVHAAKIALTDGKRFRSRCRLQHEAA
jgi:hypothetical protein